MGTLTNIPANMKRRKPATSEPHIDSVCTFKSASELRREKILQQTKLDREAEQAAQNVRVGVLKDDLKRALIKRALIEARIKYADERPPKPIRNIVRDIVIEDLEAFLKDVDRSIDTTFGDA